MKQILLIIAFAISPYFIKAQFANQSQDTTWKNIYRGSYPKINSVVHTKLDVKFDFVNSYLIGKEWLTLEPYFYPTDSVRLDAKGMDFKEVAVINGTVKTPLKYEYDGLQLNMKLDKTYKGGEKYTLYFDYVSKPNEYKGAGSAAITDAKGLYFINPQGLEKNKPTQIWTQGETEANSVWFVTIDKPNQKTTQEISMTVPTKFVTLSNGILSSQKTNKDSTRTDTWKMDLPHAPYLVFMGVGEFTIVKDSYKGKEVSYYVDKKNAPYARGVFGETPEMIKFFEEKLNVPYVWPKYSQMVGKDYVSGAMENTTATLHDENAYQNNRELVDGNIWESTIAHELFHHWFGDLVTAESWSNLTLNESFANYSEYLWNEYKHGKYFADADAFKDMQGYLFSKSENKDLVRYYYSDKEDMFDAVSYNKGGRILHMLRNYVGDDAFFKSLNVYLTSNKFKSAEASQLRMAFEEVTGKDLHWFWNQWYYGSGNPKLNINYQYNDSAKIAKVIVEQTQKGNSTFKLPVAIDVYESGKKTRHNVWIQNLSDTFIISYKIRPTLINVDADKILLTEKTDNKTEANFIEQWNNASNYLDKKEALDFFAKKTMPEIAKGLTDKFEGLRIYTMQKIASTPYKDDAVVLANIEDMAKKDR
ncbi:MAG: M1 family metallopeptidase, partial [Ferruginibacter sp.]